MMKHNIIKRGMIFVFVLALVLFTTSFAFAATIGQQLTTPESGWQRFDDCDSRIVKIGSYKTYTDSGLYGGNAYHSTGDDSRVKFSFLGTKLRLIGWTYPGYRVSEIDVLIDATRVVTFSQVTTSSVQQSLDYEVTGLANKVHSVEIVPHGSEINKNYVLDAIDIDDTGKLIDINTPTNLQATSGDGNVSLTWDKVDSATSYNIKRSTTKGGPYTNIATVTDTKYPDSAVSNGTTYYYVVSAVTSNGEGPNSNEATATPQKAAFTGNSILDIKLDDGTVKEYRLTSDEITDFVTWYQKRSQGEASAFYMFQVKGDISPFSSVYDFIPFNKILYFEVKNYNS